MYVLDWMKLIKILSLWKLALAVVLLPFLLMFVLVAFENIRLLLVTGLGLSSLFAIISATRQLQEMYYYGLSDIEWDGLKQQVSMLGILDGYFKEIKCQFSPDTAFAGGFGNFGGIMTRISKGDYYAHYVAGSSETFQDPFQVADFSVEGTLAYLSPNDQNSDLWIIDIQVGRVSHYRARINQIIKKNEEFHITNELTWMDKAAHSSGSGECRWEILCVVAPWVFWFDKSVGLGMRFNWLIRVTTAEEWATSMFPCAGYITNMSIISTVPSGPADYPAYFIFTTDDINSIDYLVTTGGTNSIRGSKSNSVVFENVKNYVNNDTFTFNYQHFGSKYIRLVNRAGLNFIYTAQGADSIFMWFTADFIPFKGALWKQIYVHDQTVSTGDNFQQSIQFPVDLDDCNVGITASIAASEGGIMVVELLNRGDDPTSTFAVEKGDIMDNTPLTDTGLQSAQNIGGIIPFSGSMGSAGSSMSLGNVKSSQQLTWDFITENLTSASKIYFTITGNVGKQYFSKGNKYLMAAGLFNYANREVFR